eukprot:3349301-Prymnesium_polylepis.1
MSTTATVATNFCCCLPGTDSAPRAVAARPRYSCVFASSSRPLRCCPRPCPARRPSRRPPRHSRRPPPLPPPAASPPPRS